MPVYCYRVKGTGELVELQMSIGQMLRRQRRDGTLRHKGRTLERDMLAEQQKTAHFAGAWPLTSSALGVNPEQVPAAIEEAARAGIKINFTQDGDAIFTGPRHRKEYAEFRGVFDGSGGYSDPQP